MSLPINYGSHLGFSDEEYKSFGVNLLDSEEELIENSDIIVQLGLLSDEKLSLLKENQTLIGSLNAFSNKEILEKQKVKITRLAHGVPIGGELDFLDDGTIAQALKARNILQ